MFLLPMPLLKTYHELLCLISSFSFYTSLRTSSGELLKRKVLDHACLVNCPENDQLNIRSFYDGIQDSAKMLYALCLLPNFHWQKEEKPTLESKLISLDLSHNASIRNKMFYFLYKGDAHDCDNVLQLIANGLLSPSDVLTNGSNKSDNKKCSGSSDNAGTFTLSKIRLSKDTSEDNKRSLLLQSTECNLKPFEHFQMKMNSFGGIKWRVYERNLHVVSMNDYDVVTLNLKVRVLQKKISSTAIDTVCTDFLMLLGAPSGK